jgi:hypothetical protein
MLGPVRWLYELSEMRSNTIPGGDRRNNLIWKAVAIAPAGFSHVNSSMSGMLLDEIREGYLTGDLNIPAITRRIAEMLDPLHYQRPKAAPSAGNIDHAEKLIDKLGVSASLRRRYARLEDIEALWKPVEPLVKPRAGGLFSHLRQDNQDNEIYIGVIPVPITWEKFRRMVLPDALEIYFYIQPNREVFAAMVTAADPAAPPILQWDREERRNPVSTYNWRHGSMPEDWNLKPGNYCRVTAVSLLPSMWGPEPLSHFGKGVFFILEGAIDRRSEKAGLALFPETLRSELREIRSTIEAFSKAGRLEEADKATACGVVLMAGNQRDIRLRAKSKLSTLEYKLDRWD